MTLTKDLTKDEEVLQSYGDKPNAMLLLDYGFVLPKSAVSASVSMTIPTPQIPDTDPQVILKKKQLWSSSGGRFGRETVLELNRLTLISTSSCNEQQPFVVAVASQLLVNQAILSLRWRPGTDARLLLSKCWGVANQVSRWVRLASAHSKSKIGRFLLSKPAFGS